MRIWETRFEELRKDKGFKQKDIAKILNVPEDRYSKWERQINDLPITVCNSLANFYNVSLDFLLGLSKYNIKTKTFKFNQQKLLTRLLKLRKEKKLSQSELGNKIGFSKSTYSSYEKGRTNITTYKLCYIAMFYSISFDYLIGRTDIKQII